MGLFRLAGPLYNQSELSFADFSDVLSIYSNIKTIYYNTGIKEE